MYNVYVLQSKENDKYIGYTRNIRERLKEHNSGMNKSTKGKQWRVVYVESYLAKEDATMREKRLKDDGRARYQLMKRIEKSLEHKKK